MIVDIDHLLAFLKRKNKINAEDIEDIIWIKDGEEVEFGKEDLERFAYTGLNNTGIINVYNWKRKED